mmetsp:Transcript_2139/g.3616  ORF Transcript_2139/g.3616 Transcript_2139/m.3616 type:complete len:85 (-) Transcript_2139:260-514(-)
MVVHHPPPHPGMTSPKMMPPPPVMARQGVPNQVMYQQPEQMQTNMDFESTISGKHVAAFRFSKRRDEKLPLGDGWGASDPSFSS